MWSVTLQASRTCIKCEDYTFLAWPSLLFDGQRFLGFQLGLNKVQFETLGDFVPYLCFYRGLKI